MDTITETGAADGALVPRGEPLDQQGLGQEGRGSREGQVEREQQEPLAEQLTEEQEFLLKKCENIIRIGLGTFVEVGLALKEIQDQRLYRRTDATFEDYLQRTIGLSRPYAYNLIESAKLMRELRNHPELDRSLLPKNEAQARELARVEPAKRLEVWKKVVDVAAGLPFTAKLIREVARETRSESSKNPATATPLSPEAGLALGRVKRLRELFANTHVAEDALQLIEKLERLALSIGAS